MPPRPLHRWKSFWLGVLVVVFLGWAWVRSMKHNDSLLYGLGLGAEWLRLGQSSAVVEVSCGDEFGTNPGLYVQHFSNDLPSWGDVLGSWFPAAITWQSWPALWSLSLAHWFLILLFLLPWTTWLVGRSRRMKRLAPGTAGPQTGSKGP